MRMPYAHAYDIRIPVAEAMAGARPRRDRPGLPGFLAAALLHRRHPRARDIRVALSAAGGPRHVRERGDGVRGGADLAGTAPSPPGRCTAASVGSTCCTAIPAACARWSSARRPRSDRSWPSAMCCWRPCGCGSRSTATSPAGSAVRLTPAPHGPQRDACAVHHHQPHLDSDPLHHAAPVAGQRIWRERGALPVGGRRRRSLAGLDDPDVLRCTGG